MHSSRVNELKIVMNRNKRSSFEQYTLCVTTIIDVIVLVMSDTKEMHFFLKKQNGGNETKKRDRFSLNGRIYIEKRKEEEGKRKKEKKENSF